MKTRITISLLFTLIFSSTTFATTWIVDSNTGNSSRDFTAIDAAFDDEAVVSGDTLMLMGSSVTYGDLITSSTKSLVIIGPGYFLGENTDLQANPSSALIGYVGVSAGAAGTVFVGLEITGSVDVDANNITFSRCYIHGSVNGDMIDIGGTSTPIANIIFTQCFIENTSGAGNNDAISVDSDVANLFINNCNVAVNNSSSKCIESSDSNTSVQVQNNVFQGPISISGNGTYINNIMTVAVNGQSSTFSAPNVTPEYNMADGTQMGSENGNLENVVMTDVFVFTGSTDGQWQLKEGGPASGQGKDATDMGMYGGVNPYVLSGVPSIPSVYLFSSPISGSKSGGLQVEIRIKSHN